jgi:hypothetical protein
MIGIDKFKDIYQMKFCDGFAMLNVLVFENLG